MGQEYIALPTEVRRLVREDVRRDFEGAEGEGGPIVLPLEITFGSGQNKGSPILRAKYNRLSSGLGELIVLRKDRQEDSSKSGVVVRLAQMVMEPQRQIDHLRAF